MMELNNSDSASGPEFWQLSAQRLEDPRPVPMLKWQFRAGIAQTSGEVAERMFLAMAPNAPSYSRKDASVTESKLPARERDTARLSLRVLTALHNIDRPVGQKTTQTEVLEDWANRHNLAGQLGGLATEVAADEQADEQIDAPVDTPAADEKPVEQDPLDWGNHVDVPPAEAEISDLLQQPPATSDQHA